MGPQHYATHPERTARPLPLTAELVDDGEKDGSHEDEGADGHPLFNTPEGLRG